MIQDLPLLGRPERLGQQAALVQEAPEVVARVGEVPAGGSRLQAGVDADHDDPQARGQDVRQRLGSVTADYSSRVSALAVTRHGSGPCVVLVHGSVTNGDLTWRAQAPLAERYTLLVVDRPGFGDAPPPDGRVDWETDAALVAEALPEGAHLVGHSYGAVIALLAAARRPEAVASLTVVEPPAFAVARGDPDVERFVAQAAAHWQDGPDDPEAFLRRFLELVSPTSPPLQSPVGGAAAGRAPGSCGTSGSRSRP